MVKDTGGSAQLRTGGNLYAEDIVLPSSTYTAGGYILTVTGCGQLTKVRSVSVKGPTGTTQSLVLLAACMVGSESPSANTFACKLYQGGTNTTQPFQELPSGSALGEGLTVSVIYEGSP